MRCFSIFLAAFFLGVQTVACAKVDLLDEPNRNLRRQRQPKRRRFTPPEPVPPVQQNTVNTQIKPCLLFFEARDNLNEDQFKWRCKMKGQDATNAGAIGGLHAYIDIQGIEYVLAANPDIVSGETLLLAVGAVVENHLLVITPNNELKFDTHSHPSGAVGRRKLATPTGNKDVLVVRVIATDNQPSATAAEMSDAIFGTNGDPVNLKSQYEGCSDNQMTITPAVGTGTACADDPDFLGFFQFQSGNYADCDWFTFFQALDPTSCTTYGNRADLGGGAETGNNACCACGGGTTSNYNLNVVDGVLEINVPVAATSLTSNQLEEAALNELEAQVGSTNLEEQFDLVMLCLPPGTTDGSWVAYAGLPGYVSVFNDNTCLYPSVQMHEVGHNIGLAHSSDVTDSNVEYGDRTGVMGVSYYVDDGPRKAKMCFNPAKSYTLGWYDDKNLDLDLAAQSFCGRIVGVANYPTIAGDEKVVLKIPDTSVDYYVGYNHAVGFHEGTNEAIDQVTVVSQDPTFGSFSYLEARLSTGNDYVISNILGSGEDVTIRVVDIDSSDSGFAEVQVFRGASDCDAPSALPSMAPSRLPSRQPSTLPSLQPSVAPSIGPSLSPSIMPSLNPSSAPSIGPSQLPSIMPSSKPSILPSLSPSSPPSLSDAPSLSSAPSSLVVPVASAGTVSLSPSQEPSTIPSLAPSRFPSTVPSIMPSNGPSKTPSIGPSQSPSILPSGRPSTEPSIGPSQSPSIMPSQGPTVVASNSPSTSPSIMPSSQPSQGPTHVLNTVNSVSPSQSPSVLPSIAPSTSTNGGDQWNCLFNEDFENGLQYFSRRGCVGITNRAGAGGSQYSMRLAGRDGVSSETANSYDVSQYTSIRVTFEYRTVRMPSRGGFYLDTQINGGSWSTWQRFGVDSSCSRRNSGTWCTGQAELVLTGANTVQFRFRTWRTRRYKKLFIDNVKFEAFGAPSSTANGECPSAPVTQGRSGPSSGKSSSRRSPRPRGNRRRNPKRGRRNHFFRGN